MGSLILFILVITPGVWSANWGVTLQNQCALKGTSVIIKCTYGYPAGHSVMSVGWYKGQYVSGQWKLFSLSNLPSPPDHRYVGNYWSDCSLKINDVHYADAGAYYFSFVTTFNRWTSRTFASLSVKELTAVVKPSTVTEGDNVSLTCASGCDTPVDTVWYRDGRRIRDPVFQARREDAGSYYCAILGQETVRSASVALNVQYAPKKVTLSMNPSRDVVRGSLVTFTCSSDARPPVQQSGYSLYKDGHFISSGQNYTVSDIQPGHNGLYYCQAWNNISWRGIDLINSTEVHLSVQYRPVNISISINPPHVVLGGSVNLTCSSDANPAADNYTWYKRTPPSNSMLQVGSGQMLPLSSMDTSHTGLYLCQATNRLGGNNSTEMLLAMREEKHGSVSLPVVGGVAVSLFVTLVLARLFFWRKHRTHGKEKQTVFDHRLRGKDSSSSATEDPSNSVYVNIHTLPSSPPPVTGIIPHSQGDSHHKRDAPGSYEDEVTYSTVTVKPRTSRLSLHVENGRGMQNSGSKVGKEEESVIYSTVAKSN